MFEQFKDVVKQKYSNTDKTIDDIYKYIFF